MIDGGKLDDKIIAIPFSDPTYRDIKSFEELPQHIFDEIMHFFMPFGDVHFLTHFFIYLNSYYIGILFGVIKPFRNNSYTFRQ